jgi:RNA polymerase sigma-70 factor, ECF subfamily
MTAAHNPLVAPLSPDSSNEFRDKIVELIPNLRAFARTLSGHRNEADDLCQEALAKAWQSRASFEPGTNMKAWLFVILRNQFYSEKRRSWRSQPWDEEIAERRLVTKGSQEAAAELSDVARAMQSLPDEQREALILVGAGEFSYQEAADVCSCAVGTVKSRVSRGRQGLQALLAGKPRRADKRRSDGRQDILGELDRLAPVDNRVATPVLLSRRAR